MSVVGIKPESISSLGVFRILTRTGSWRRLRPVSIEVKAGPRGRPCKIDSIGAGTFPLCPVTDIGNIGHYRPDLGIYR